MLVFVSELLLPVPVPPWLVVPPWLGVALVPEDVLVLIVALLLGVVALLLGVVTLLLGALVIVLLVPRSVPY